MRSSTSCWRLLLLAFVCVLVAILLGCSGGGPDAAAPDEGGQTVSDEVIPEEDAVESEEVVSSEEQSRAKPRASRGASDAGDGSDLAIPESASCTSKDEVAWYLHTYGHLPDNFVTKDEAMDAGWKTEGLTVDEACPGCSIGGDYFGNYERRLPEAAGRTWRECDIDTRGKKSRGSKRIVYSSDGLIYYTEDHYKTFERLY